MKATGIVRKVDELGRIVIPIELRRILDIDVKDPVEIFADGEYVMLKKFSPLCYLCGSQYNLVVFKEKNVCQDCIKGL
jgi:transcriptional pleiotropic regulator of transition state genes